MDDDEAARYLRQRVPVPASLREHFGGAADLPRAEAAATLATAMGLRSDEQPTFIVGLMLVLLEAVARTVAEGPREPEDRGSAIADNALAHFTVDECLAIAGYFGGDHVAVPAGTTLGSLSATVHRVLGQCIGDPVNGALGAWSSGS
jgi:hypothetical protein